MLTKEQFEAIARDMKHFETRAFIDGQFVDCVSGHTFPTINPATGQKLAYVADCDAQDVEIAVQAARRSFESGCWSRLSPADRKKTLLVFADLIMKHQDELAVMETLDSGKPIRDTYDMDVPETANCFAWHAEAADKLEDQVTATGSDNVSIVVREPIGVVGAILPWNFPMQMAAWKLAPILATGNSVIVKPSEFTPLTLLRLAELSVEAGIPEGVLNVVPGAGSDLGKAISVHMDIDLITFTGSTAVGKTLLVQSGQSNLKRVLLELGGKNPCIIMPDVTDLDTVADEVLNAALWNMGENCTANSRVIVHKDIKDRLLAKLVEKVKDWHVGMPLDPANNLGALITKNHMEKVLGFIEAGKAEGATVVSGGKQIMKETGGYFVEPTIFDHVTSDMTIARKEIFGPVFGIFTFSDVDEAIAMANDTEYGLHSSIWTNDVNLVHRLSRAVRAGTVSVNCYSEGDIGTPFGGFKNSGFFGRDKSLWANRQFTELKTIWMQIR